MYPALLTLMRTPRLSAFDRTDAPADLNGFVLFGERRNLVSARVPSRFKSILPPNHNTRVFSKTAVRKSRLAINGLLIVETGTSVCLCSNIERLQEVSILVERFKNHETLYGRHKLRTVGFGFISKPS